MPILVNNEGCSFRVWAPEKGRMLLHLLDDGRLLEMQKSKEGYFNLQVVGVKPGQRYFYRPEGEQDHPDPASHYQPVGIHGPSEVVDHAAYRWNDGNWRGVPLRELIFYELHVGTFTPEGNFEAAIGRLKDIADTGINAIELMPVAQFPGDRNWGYDGTFLYAVQNNYGGPEGLRRFVDACHGLGIAVFLDVVYNHIGAEGNYWGHFGPYFSDRYQTPWGKALNFDGDWSDGVKNLVVDNILYWAEHFHIDGLRMDAVHEIFDRNAVRIWDELQEARANWEQRSGRRLYLVAESDLNSPRVVAATERGGYGFDSQWMDDLHHSLYVLLDRDGAKHYTDYGGAAQLAKAYTEGFVHTGEWVGFRHRRHGVSSAGLKGWQFVVFIQNHDTAGNRPGGERLTMLVDRARVKLAAAVVLLSPYLPLLFMGEEYGEDVPFNFFSDHLDAQLAEGLREGRKKEFKAFDWGADPPDPQKKDVFEKSKLDWEKRGRGHYKEMLEWYRTLIRLRRTQPLLYDLSRSFIRADQFGEAGVAVLRHSADRASQLLCLFNFSPGVQQYTLPGPSEEWTCLASSFEGGSAGSALQIPGWGAAVYHRGDNSTIMLRAGALTTDAAG